MAGPNGLIFLTSNKDIFIDHIHKDNVGENFFEVSLLVSTKNFILLQIEKNDI